MILDHSYNHLEVKYDFATNAVVLAIFFMIICKSLKKAKQLCEIDTKRKGNARQWSLVCHVEIDALVRLVWLCFFLGYVSPRTLISFQYIIDFS